MADTIAGNTSTTAFLPINSSATNSIDSFGDTDWWRVDLSAGFGYQIWIEGSQYGVGTLADPYLAVYNSAGAFQLSNNDLSIYYYDSYCYFAPGSTGT